MRKTEQHKTVGEYRAGRRSNRRTLLSFIVVIVSITVALVLAGCQSEAQHRAQVQAQVQGLKALVDVIQQVSGQPQEAETPEPLENTGDLDPAGLLIIASPDCVDKFGPELCDECDRPGADNCLVSGFITQLVSCADTYGALTCNRCLAADDWYTCLRRDPSHEEMIAWMGHLCNSFSTPYEQCLFNDPPTRLFREAYAACIAYHPGSYDRCLRHPWLWADVTKREWGISEMSKYAVEYGRAVLSAEDEAAAEREGIPARVVLHTFAEVASVDAYRMLLLEECLSGWGYTLAVSSLDNMDRVMGTRKGKQCIEGLRPRTPQEILNLGRQYIAERRHWAAIETRQKKTP